MSRYLVPRRDAVAEIEERRSRFRCTLARVDDEDAVRALVAGLRREHPDARHHGSAFVLGPGGRLERSHDDGEPSGTAGAPMLEVLRGSGVNDVAAVVTRWFGGTLLGAGGLVRAYGDAVRAALEVAGTRERRLLREVDLVVGHADAGRVEGELRQRGVVVLDVAYGAEVTLRLGVEADDEARLRGSVAELTGGAGIVVPVGERWVDGR